MIIALTTQDASILKSLVDREMEERKLGLSPQALANLSKKLPEGDLQPAQEAIHGAIEGLLGHRIDAQTMTAIEALSFGSAVLARAGKSGTPTSTR